MSEDFAYSFNVVIFSILTILTIVGTIIRAREARMELRNSEQNEQEKRRELHSR